MNTILAKIYVNNDKSDDGCDKDVYANLTTIFNDVFFLFENVSKYFNLKLTLFI